MPIVDAYAERKYQEVMRDTWGHLAPKRGEIYRGTITFAHGAFGGDTAFLSIDFRLEDGTEMEGNPWSYEALTDYIVQWICDQANGWRDRKPVPPSERFDVEGGVFTFTGSYTAFKNGSTRIVGKFKQRQIA